MEVFCYLVFDEQSREGILIDPAGNEDELLKLLQSEGVRLRYVLNTHGHADHTCGNNTIRKATGALVVMHALDDDFFQEDANRQWAKTMGFNPAPPADVRVNDGDEIQFGNNIGARFVHTPGHTPGACCILIGGNLFTGDTLFVGAVGRTDLPGGSFEQLIESIRTKILPLPRETIIWPGHDYGDSAQSTIGREMSTNPYITDFLLEEE